MSGIEHNGGDDGGAAGQARIAFVHGEFSLPDIGQPLNRARLIARPPTWKVRKIGGGRARRKGMSRFGSRNARYTSDDINEHQGESGTFVPSKTWIGSGRTVSGIGIVFCERREDETRRSLYFRVHGSWLPVSCSCTDFSRQRCSSIVFRR